VRFGLEITGYSLPASLFRWRLPLIRQQLWPLYVQKGIIPEAATGLRAATEPATSPQNPGLDPDHTGPV